jgi:hypothetical protein
MAISYPLVNGKRLGWSRIKIAVDKVGGEIFGFRAIMYKNAIERGKVRGHGRQVLGFTEGDLDSDASITMLEEEWRAFIAVLGSGYMDVPFTTTVSYVLPDGTTTSDQLVGCLIKEDPHDHSQGVDGLEVSVPLDLLYVKVAGLNPINDFRE